MSLERARVIALDVGGTSVKSGVVAAGRIVLGRPALTAIDSLGPADAFLDTLAQTVGRWLPDVRDADFRGVAFGFPGPFEYDAGVCRIRGLGKFESLYGLNIAHALRARLDAPLPAVVFRNDAEAAIVGEALSGAGRPFTRVIGITLGTGLGSAFVAGGKSAVSSHEALLYCQPFRGVRADDWFSRRGIESRLVARGAPPDVRAAAESARAGDRDLRRLFADLGDELALFLRPFVESFGAEVVLVLGRIAGAFDLFGPSLARGLPVPALLAERPDDAALVGAAELLLGPNLG